MFHISHSLQAYGASEDVVLSLIWRSHLAIHLVLGFLSSKLILLYIYIYFKYQINKIHIFKRFIFSNVAQPNTTLQTYFFSKLFIPDTCIQNLYEINTISSQTTYFKQVINIKWIYDYKINMWFKPIIKKKKKKTRVGPRAC